MNRTRTAVLHLIQCTVERMCTRTPQEQRALAVYTIVLIIS